MKFAVIQTNADGAEKSRSEIECVDDPKELNRATREALEWMTLEVGDQIRLEGRA